MLKDYYFILGLEPSATLAEIKKAYRKLALQFHPDKNHQDPYASAQFTEIKEAYEVLTDPSKKAYYLQQRWYNQSTGRRTKQATVTPVTILKQALELEKYVSRLDHFRMDTKGLQEYILELVNNDTIEKLNRFKEEATNDTIVDTLLHCVKPLPFALTVDVIRQLQKIRTNDPTSKKLADHAISRQKKYRRERYTIWVILLLVILFCLLIFFFGGKNSKP